MLAICWNGRPVQASSLAGRVQVVVVVVVGRGPGKAGPLAVMLEVVVVVVAGSGRALRPV